MENPPHPEAAAPPVTDKDRRLEGRVVVVTGGNAGLGLSLARGAGRAGATIVIWSRRADRNRAAVDALELDGIRASATTCDVSDEDSVDLAMSTALAAYGRVDSMVANAGVSTASRFVDHSLEEWRRVLSTNLDGAFLCTRAAARHFVERGEGGAIVLVSSMASRLGGSGQAAYNTSKTGLLGLGRSLAVELARHQVRVNTLVPGWITTDLTAEASRNERLVSASIQRTPVRRWADPAEFEPVAAFLVDPTLTFHTGNEVVVDGGYTIA